MTKLRVDYGKCHNSLQFLFLTIIFRALKLFKLVVLPVVVLGVQRRT